MHVQQYGAKDIGITNLFCTQDEKFCSTQKAVGKKHVCTLYMQLRRKFESRKWFVMRRGRTNDKKMMDVPFF
jgi:hypothetical protein